ncbi:MAG: hypothetical protein IPO98_02325 [Saprospiraceae bacterium]|nr:hypothetical protein [Saprospiraceae bacterium]
MDANFYGIVSMISLENVCPPAFELSQKTDTDSFLTENHIKIVHYPDCQQLIIWLPADGSLYRDMVFSDQISGDEIWRKDINGILSGSIQIILDTLPIEPGELTIKIYKNNGLTHKIYLKKYEEGVFPELPVSAPEVESTEDRPYIVYRDGFGNILPNEDLILRDNAIQEMVRKFTRKVTFEDSGRSSKVIYIDGDKSASFYSEMGGGNCLFYIDIPTKDTWERETGFRLAERDDIILFVAENTLRAQTNSSGAHFKIEDRWIIFYKGR